MFSITAVHSRATESRKLDISRVCTIVFAAGALVLLATSSAHSQTCAAYTYTLSNGTTADANQVMSNFETVRNCANTLASGGTLTNPTLTDMTATGTNNISGVTNITADSPGIITINGPQVVIKDETTNRGVELGENSALGRYSIEVEGGAFQISNGTGSIVLRTYNGHYSGITNFAPGTGNHLCYNSSVVTGADAFATCSSLKKYKDRIASLSLGLDVVLNLQPVSYIWRDSGYPDVGFIAEDVEAIDPILATYLDGKLDGVKYEHLTAVLAKAVQEVSGAIDVRQALDAAPTLRSSYRGSNAPAITVSGSGTVGIGIGAADAALTVNGAIVAAAPVAVVADSRLRTDVKPIDDALALVSQLRGIEFQWQAPEERAEGAALKLPAAVPQLGLDADSVKRVLPQAVGASGDDDIVTIQSDAMIPVLVEAVKQLTAINRGQAAELADLRQKIAALRADMRQVAAARDLSGGDVAVRTPARVGQ